MANRFQVKVPVTRDPKEPEASVVHVKELGAEGYDAEVKDAPQPVVLDFYAAGSAPCDALAPRYAAVAGKFSGKVRFLKASQKAHPELASRLGVTVAPTLLFFKNGQELGERLSGEDIQRTELKARVEALLK